MITWLPRCRTRLKPCLISRSHNSAPEKTRSLGMRYFEFFNRNFPFVQSTTNLRLIRALQPEFDCFLDHFFRVLRALSLTNDPQFGATSDIPTIFARFNYRGEFRKFHREEFTSAYRS